jgi:hypothetical protein
LPGQRSSETSGGARFATSVRSISPLAWQSSRDNELGRTVTRSLRCSRLAISGMVT